MDGTQQRLRLRFDQHHGHDLIRAARDGASLAHAQVGDEVRQTITLGAWQHQAEGSAAGPVVFETDRGVEVEVGSDCHASDDRTCVLRVSRNFVGFLEHGADQEEEADGHQGDAEDGANAG
jgi:hypothetical protein